MSACNKLGCNEHPLLVMRIQTEIGPHFIGFCRAHLDVAAKVVAELAVQECTPPAPAKEKEADA